MTPNGRMVAHPIGSEAASVVERLVQKSLRPTSDTRTACSRYADSNVQDAFESCDHG